MYNFFNFKKRQTELQPKDTVDQIIIDVGQRYSVLINGGNLPGNYKINASADPNLGFSLRYNYY